MVLMPTLCFGVEDLNLVKEYCKKEKLSEPDCNKILIEVKKGLKELDTKTESSYGRCDVDKNDPNCKKKKSKRIKDE